MDDLDLFPDDATDTTPSPTPAPAPSAARIDEDAEMWREAATPDPLVDLASEQGALGAILLDNSLLADVGAKVHRGDFADPRHGTILDALVAIDGKPDAVTPMGTTNLPALCAELRRVGRLNTVGGAQYVAALARFLPSAVHAHVYAATVAEFAARRRLRDVGDNLATRANDLRTPVDVVTDKALREVEHAGKNSDAESSQVSVGASLLRVASRVGEVATRGLTLPWPSIDHAIRGLRGGRTHYIAAKTSMGKSSLARNLATALAAPSLYYDPSDARSQLDPAPVLFFSLEMPTDENAVQVMASILRCSGPDVESGNVHMPEYCHALRTLERAPLVFDDATDSVAQMLALSRQFVRKHKRGGAKQAVIMLDYLQLCDPFGLAMEKSPTRERMVAVMSREWKRFAVREDVPLVILSQLNRDCEDEVCPKLSHLRESGSVEQDADVVMFLWGKLPDGHALTQDITATLAKIRGGPRGVAVPMTFQRKATRFYELGAVEADAQHGGRDSVVRDIRPGVRRAANDHDPRFVDGDTGTDDAQ